MINPLYLYATIGFLLAVFLGIVIGIIVFLFKRRWNIPVVILRYTGDRRRPLLITTRGKKEVIDNCVQLRVKTYKRRFRDFLSANYYPSPGVPFGAILCFEFEDGWLTPLQPALKKLSKDQRIEADKYIKQLQMLTKDVEFNYDAAVHDALKLNIIDDVDSESYLIDQTRIRQQYQGALGWLATHGTVVVMIVLLICLTVGFVVWVKEPPVNAAQACVAQLRGVCSDAWNITITENKAMGQSIMQKLGESMGVPPG